MGLLCSAVLDVSRPESISATQVHGYCEAARLEIPVSSTENGGRRRRRPTRAGALPERGVFLLLPHFAQAMLRSCLPMHTDRSVCACVRATSLCRWWCSSPTSVTLPPPAPSSPGSSSLAPSSRILPASTTAAMVLRLLPPRFPPPPTLLPRAVDPASCVV
jgi:hypothetical protein